MDEELLGESFSKRHGYSRGNVEIRIREDAPPSLRYYLPRVARQHGIPPAAMRTIVCDALRTPLNRDNWSADDVAGEVDYLLKNCPWYRVYDIAENCVVWLAENEESCAASALMRCFNEFFREEGIGWEFDEAMGQIVTRGEAEFQVEMNTASETLSEAGYQTARQELELALSALSRRPNPDLTGAIQHAMAAMECVCREFCDDPQPTLGKLIDRYPDMLPRPLNQAVEKAWGYASEMGRHVREGQVLERDEAELIVGIAASVSTYLTRKKARQAGS